MSPTQSFSTFVLLKTGKVQPQTTAVLGKREYLAPDGEILKDALSVDPKNVAIGTPLGDSNGGVVAVVGRACAPGTGKAGGRRGPFLACVFSPRREGGARVARFAG